MSGFGQPYNVVKTIRGATFSEVLEDLNFNFEQIMNVFAVKGLPGKDGGPGGIGGQGSRGASFIILNIDEFQANFPSPADPNAITIDHINDAIHANAVLFFEKCTNFDDIVHNDMLILPNGIVIQYDTVTGIFQPTRLRLFNNTDVWTKEMIIQLIEEYSQQSEGLYKSYSARNKILADDAPNAETINSVFNQNAVADIATSNSGPGFEAQNIVFIALQEAAGIIGDQRAQLLNLDGHALDYHNLVQNSIAQNKMSSVPKADNLPVRALIQNQPSSGFIFGAANFNTLDKFGHIRKSLNAVEIMPYYTNDGTFITNNTVASIGENIISLRSKTVAANGIGATGAFDVQTNGVSRLNINSDRSFFANKVFVDTIKDATQQKIVSVLASGELVSVNYKTTGTLSSTGNALPIESVIVKWTTDYVNARLGWTTSETVKQLIDALRQDVTVLQQSNATLNLIANAFKGPDGAVLAYRGATIPQGWQEVVDIRGRTIVGVDPNDFALNAPKVQVGANKKKILQANIPNYNMVYQLGLEKVGTGNRNGLSRQGGNEYTQYVNSGGGGQDFDVMQASYTCRYIEFIG
ncbi:hypothetical protein MA9V1_016 [Chryseobacterium phage MA9V-1]|nr:hypothetical protein MA9V1_016 [Chryseobacterium phage MA9V-1]